MSDGLRDKTVASLVWKLLERGGYQGIQLVVQIILARLLSPADFGMLAILLVFINVAAVIVQSGLNTALIQAIQVTHQDSSTVFWINIVLAALLYCALFALSPQVSAWYGFPELTVALRVLGLTLFVNALNSIQVGLAAREFDFRSIFVATVFAGGTSGILGIGMASRGLGYWALIAQQLGYQLVLSILLAYRIAWRPRLEFETRSARNLLAYGWKIASASLLDTFYLGLYDLTVGKVFSPATLGSFSQGKRLPMVTNSILDGTIQAVMLPALSRLQADPTRAARALRRSLSISTLGVASLMGAMYVAAPSLITVMLSEKWAAAVPYVRAFSILYAVQPIQTGNLQAIAASGRSDLILRTNLVKRAIGVAILGFTSLVLRDPHLVAVGAVVDGYLAAAINASMSGRLYAYGILQQIRDLLPTFGITIASVVITGAATAPMSVGASKLMVQLVLFTTVQAAAVLGTRVPAATDVLETLRQYAGTRKSKQK